MKNRVLEKNFKRTFLTVAMTIAILFLAGALSMFLILKISRDQNYDSNFTSISDTVSKASADAGSDVWFLYLEDDDRKYCTTPVEGMQNWIELEGKSVEIFIPAKQIVVSNPLVLGLKIEENLVIDPSETAKRMRNENTDLTVIMIIAMAFATACWVIFVWRLHVPKCKETSLASAYAKWIASVTPNYAGDRFVVAIIALEAGICLLSSILTDEMSKNIKSASVWIPIAAVVVGAAAIFFLLRLAKLKKNEFFIRNFPFDFGDPAYMRLPKRLRKKSEQSNKEFNEKHPHTFGDGGNGIWAVFGKTGVDLFTELENQSQQEKQIFEEMPTYDQIEPFLRLSYDRLNFEAIAFLHPTAYTNALVVVVKSRLKETDEAIINELHFAEDTEGKLLHDLHFAFDTDLLNTLRKFDVSVENLDYILQNYAELIVSHKKMSTYPENFDS